MVELVEFVVDIVFMWFDLKGILIVMDLSCKLVYCIIFNFMWSFVYNLFVVLLVVGVFMLFNNVRILLEFVGLGELVSVLFVILVVLFLKWVRFWINWMNLLVVLLIIYGLRRE